MSQTTPAPAGSTIRTAPRLALSRAAYFQQHGEPKGETRDLMLFNADRLIARVNGLLVEAWEAGVDVGVDQVTGTYVASGRRSPGANAATANAATASTHLTCEGIDIQDLRDRRFAAWCIRHLKHLEESGLWLEDPRWTGGRTNTDPWVHLQTKAPRSGRRVYVPSSEPATDPDFYARNGLTLPT